MHHDPKKIKTKQQVDELSHLFPTLSNVEIDTTHRHMSFAEFFFFDVCENSTIVLSSLQDKSWDRPISKMARASLAVLAEL